VSQFKSKRSKANERISVWCFLGGDAAIYRVPVPSGRGIISLWIPRAVSGWRKRQIKECEMTQDEIIEIARQAGIYHAQDSEYHWDGLTDQKIIERTPDSAKDIAWRNRRTFEILQPFAKLVAEKAIKEALAQPEQIQPSAYSNTHQLEERNQ
jgi:hypothetical protein